MSEAGGMSEQAISSAAASLRGPTSWEYSVRKHCEVLTIPLDLRETGWMLLKLKKFVNAVCAPTAELAAGKNPARTAVRQGDFDDGEDAQELACAHKEV